MAEHIVLTKTELRMVFNEWLRRYQEEPAKSQKPLEEWQPESYGEASADYFIKVAEEVIPGIENRPFICSVALPDAQVKQLMVTGKTRRSKIQMVDFEADGLITQSETGPRGETLITAFDLHGVSIVQPQE